jgi:hypothetical protein
MVTLVKWKYNSFTGFRRDSRKFETEIIARGPRNNSFTGFRRDSRKFETEIIARGPRNNPFTGFRRDSRKFETGIIARGPRNKEMDDVCVPVLTILSTVDYRMYVQTYSTYLLACPRKHPKNMCTYVFGRTYTFFSRHVPLTYFCCHRTPKHVLYTNFGTYIFPVFGYMGHFSGFQSGPLPVF